MRIYNNTANFFGPTLHAIDADALNQEMAQTFGLAGDDRIEAAYSFAVGTGSSASAAATPSRLRPSHAFAKLSRIS